MSGGPDERPDAPSTRPSWPPSTPTWSATTCGRHRPRRLSGRFTRSTSGASTATCSTLVSPLARLRWGLRVEGDHRLPEIGPGAAGPQPPPGPVRARRARPRPCAGPPTAPAVDGSAGPRAAGPGRPPAGWRAADRADLRSLLRAGELVGLPLARELRAPASTCPVVPRSRSRRPWPPGPRSCRWPSSGSRSAAGGSSASARPSPPGAAARRGDPAELAEATRQRLQRAAHRVATGRPGCRRSDGSSRRPPGVGHRPMACAQAADGTRLHYEVFGPRHGEPLLLIQGLGADSRGWIRQRRALAGRYRCIVFDNRGAGRSDHPAGALRPRGHGRRRPGRARRGRRGAGPRARRVDGWHPRPDRGRAAPRSGSARWCWPARPVATTSGGGSCWPSGRRWPPSGAWAPSPAGRALADRSPLPAPLLAGRGPGRPAGHDRLARRLRGPGGGHPGHGRRPAGASCRASPCPRWPWWAARTS